MPPAGGSANGSSSSSNNNNNGGASSSSSSSPRSMLLLLLSVCISVVVVLNLSYLPQLVSSTVKYTSQVDESVFSFQHQPPVRRKKHYVRNPKYKHGQHGYSHSHRHHHAPAGDQEEEEEEDDNNKNRVQIEVDDGEETEIIDLNDLKRQKEEIKQRREIARQKQRQHQQGQQEQEHQQQDQQDQILPDDHKIAGLNCDRFGGPSQQVAEEMVYWRDIPHDALVESPYKSYGLSTKYLTFEPDEGGWNNIRMSMETATTLAHAMGRTLVLPPGTSP